MRDKIFKELENRDWVLLNQYHNIYPMDWIATISECLENKDNFYDFRYDSTGKLIQIQIIISYGHIGPDWNFYIRFRD